MVSDTQSTEVKNERTRKRAVWVILLIGLLFIAGAAGGVTLNVFQALQPMEASEESVHIHIEPGMNSEQIAELLEDNGIIRNAKVFAYYLRYKDEGHRFQAGEYAMHPGMTLDEIIDKLNRGDIIQEETIRFTIPEGFTVSQIADKLSTDLNLDREAFMQQLQRIEDFTASSIQYIPDDPQIIQKLEGYLFPETYEMKIDSTERDIINRMLLELDHKLAQLPEGWETQLDKLGITFHEMMTIASLIEREVVIDEERPVVAGVIYNRLNHPMRLQIDATVQYAMGVQKQIVLIEDTKMDHPYNTYVIDGLPPGPIASPGIKSIQAALYPADTPYFYYVTKKDGSQGHLFSETYEEHLKNKALSEQLAK